MYFLNKYCFCSDEINNHTLIYNSQTDTCVILNFKELNQIYDCKLSNELSRKLIKLGVFKSKDTNHFDINSFKEKLQKLRNVMNSTFTFYIIMQEQYLDTTWKISEQELSECIKAIKNFSLQTNTNNITLILQYNIKYEDIELINKAQYDQNIVYYELENIKHKIIINKTKFPENNGQPNSKTDKFICQSPTYDSSDFLKHSFSNLSDKSMWKYFRTIQDQHLFENKIDSFELLCPYLSENFYVIEHATLIKKCPCISCDCKNIIGVIHNAEIVLNENIYSFNLSEDKLNSDCMQCNFIYICLGQNCRVCSNNSIVACMPLGKFIRKSLNKRLLEMMNNKSYKLQV